MDRNSPPVAAAFHGYRAHASDPAPPGACSCRIGPGASLRPGPPKNRTCTFQRIRLKPAGEGLVARHRTIRSRDLQRLVRGSVHRTLVAASNLSVGSGVVVIVSSLAHLTSSARLRARAPGPVSGRLCGTTAWRGRPSRPDFPSPFGCRPSLLGHPAARRGIRPSSRSAYRHTSDLHGVTAFRTHELRPGWVPPIPRGRRCSSRLRDVLAGAWRSTAPVPHHPARATHRSGSASRDLIEGSRCSPVRSSLAWAAQMVQTPLGLLPGFAPRRYRRRTPGWDRPSSTAPELHAHQLDPATR